MTAKRAQRAVVTAIISCQLCPLSVTFWPDPDYRLTEPDPALFVSDLQDITKPIFEGTFS
jgi:hypothetical protein